MIKITEINNDAKQQLTLVTEDGFEIKFLIEFRPTQTGWFFNLTHNDLTINGVRLCHFPNVLRQWKNIIPFGIACVVTDSGEPYYIDDFSSERVAIYLLTESEVEEIEEDIFGVA